MYTLLIPIENNSFFQNPKPHKPLSSLLSFLTQEDFFGDASMEMRAITLFTHLLIKCILEKISSWLINTPYNALPLHVLA